MYPINSKMNLMRHVGILSQMELIICIIILASSCEEKPTPEPYILPDFKNPSVTSIKNNLEFPSGLSSFIYASELKNNSKNVSQNIASGVFIEGPRFQNLHSNGGIQIDQNPKISRYEIDLEQLSTNELPINTLVINTISEFDYLKYEDDFDSFSYFGSWIILGEPDSIWRASRLLLDNCIISNDSILTSSNSSDKIFLTNSIGSTSVLLEDPDLTGITDLIYGKSKKIYAAQTPVLDQNNPNNVIRPKRLISIKNSSINTEFELPTTIGSAFLQYPENLSQWLGTPCLEQLKIVENSEEGKKRFGTEFYIADLLGNVIYKVDKSNNVDVLASDLKYPTSIAVDSMGNLFYTSSPVFKIYGYSVVTNRESLYALNPEDGATKMICAFGTSVFEEYWWHAGFGISVLYAGQRCELPLDLNITNVLYETENRLYFLITNTRLGKLYVIKLDK